MCVLYAVRVGQISCSGSQIGGHSIALRQQSLTTDEGLRFESSSRYVRRLSVTLEIVGRFPRIIRFSPPEKMANPGLISESLEHPGEGHCHWGVYCVYTYIYTH